MPPKSTFQPNTITLTERVDTNRVKELLCSDFIINGQNLDDNILVCLVEHLQSLSKTYTDSESCSRLYVRGSLSCQTLWNPIKSYIYQDSFVDIDIRNCHPSILELLCKEHDFPCPLLSLYNDNLEEYRKIYNKKDILKVIHGGIETNLPIDFRNELTIIRLALEGKTKRSFADLLFTNEVKFLQQMKAIIDQNLGQGKIVGLFHDGLVAEKIVLDYLDVINADLPNGIIAVHKPWKVPKVNIVHKLTEFDWSKNTDYVDFRHLSHSHYSNLGDAYRAVIPVVLESLRILTSGWFVKLADRVEHVKELDKKYTISYGDNKPVSLVKFIQTFSGLIELDNIVNRQSKTPTEFSIYRGFGFKRVEYTEGDLDPLDRFLYDICCDGDMDTFHHFTHWLASILQHPERKTEVMYVFSGLQGTGKSTLAYLLSKLFGRHSYQAEQGLGCLFDRFNNHLQGKNLLLLEELSGQNHKWGEIQDKLKDVITRREAKTEKKYVDVFTSDCLLNLIAFSNFDNCVGMSEGLRRRVAMVKISDEMKENHEYFSLLHNYIDDDNMIDKFGSYLMDLDLSEFNVRVIPETELKVRNIFRWAPVVRRALLILYKQRGECWILTRNVKEIIEHYFPEVKCKERIGEDIQGYLGIQHPTKRRYHLCKSNRFTVPAGLLAEAQKVIDEVDEVECMLDDEIIIE